MSTIEIRGNSVFIEGYVNGVQRESKVLTDSKGTPFIEVIAEKTFAKALERAKNIDFLVNHDKSFKIGSTSEKNVNLFEDAIGLRIKAMVDDDYITRRIKQGSAKGFSFGFHPIEQETDTSHKDGIQRRTIKNMELIEVSLLIDVEPAYFATTIETRNKNNESSMLEIRTGDIFTGKNVIEIPDYSIYESNLALLKLKGVMM